MIKKGIFGFLKISCFAIILTFFLSPNAFANKIKILHIASYHTGWEWTDEQFNGFKDALKDFDIEFKTFEMDTKRKSTEENKEEAGKKARELIQTWKPNLVLASDDNAQKYVTKFFVNSEIPFVFCGVNGEPQDYNLDKAKNITGVLEREHVVETVRLLKQIAPNIKKIAILSDDDVTWVKLAERIQKLVPKNFPEIEILNPGPIATFEEFKNKVREYQNTQDALALLGMFASKGKDGKNVPYCQAHKWTIENSKLPDFSFWKDRIPCGALCSVYVSGYEQGLAAGKLAKSILIDGKKPNELPIEPALKGTSIINLQRAKMLGLNIKSGILLNSKIIKKFEWEQ
jgi:ABC-type uncharacterized transport system substrate-binding protein